MGNWQRSSYQHISAFLPSFYEYAIISVFHSRYDIFAGAEFILLLFVVPLPLPTNCQDYLFSL